MDIFCHRSSNDRAAVTAVATTAAAVTAVATTAAAVTAVATTAAAVTAVATTAAAVSTAAVTVRVTRKTPDPRLGGGAEWRLQERTRRATRLHECPRILVQMGDVRLGHDESGSGAEKRVEGADEARPSHRKVGGAACLH
jgi:hypothetical protein